MKKMRRKPTTPGEILDQEFLGPLGISQTELARHIGCDVKVINRLVNEKTRITPEIALKLSQSFETTADFWLNAQNAVDLWKVPERKDISSILRRRRSRSSLS